jgi:hypothetical protein
MGKNIVFAELYQHRTPTDWGVYSVRTVLHAQTTFNAHTSKLTVNKPAWF